MTNLKILLVLKKSVAGIRKIRFRADFSQRRQMTLYSENVRSIYCLWPFFRDLSIISLMALGEVSVCKNFEIGNDLRVLSVGVASSCRLNMKVCEPREKTVLRNGRGEYGFGGT